jgi:lipoprotein signal peptidase
MTVAVCSVIAWLLLTGAIKGKLGRIGAGMLLGGAIGNALDRAAAGYVVDMFEFVFIRFAVFNVADIFITFGGLLFCLHVLLKEYGQKHRRACPEPAVMEKERRHGADGEREADENVGDDAQ